ncbi:MAG TPA: SpoIID/LytB domain-containing protein [Sedimentisphaerales bacterium]|nr:SpoIID/LytB domain-containing protein [Sedimentisphaerales bacterium]
MLLIGGVCACREKPDIGPPARAGEQSGPAVRVLLLKDAIACTVRLGSSFNVWVETASATGGDRKRHFEGIDGEIEIELSGETISIGDKTFEGDEISIKPDSAAVFSLDGSDYRGTLRLVVNEDGGSFDVINDVDVESYLAGVVGAEMPDYWEGQALKAQAIAARTYCLYIKQRFGTGRHWDVSKTQAHQVYRGVEGESTPIRSAVNQTKGKVLVCNQGKDGEGIFPAYYSSACGGHTENSEHVFGDSFAPLVGVECPYCVDVARPKYYFWPTARFDCEEVNERLMSNYPSLKHLGKITDIIASEQTDYGTYHRLTRIKLLGSTGKSDSLRAEDLRLTIDRSGRILKSTICEISKSEGQWVFRFGRGFGHGVGMCQCGAQAMARQGKTAEQILEYYYPGSRITGAW